MIKFTDESIYLKGTCNAICEDIDNGNVVYQSSKMSTGSINASTEMTEVRFGIGNPVASMIPSNSKIEVDFEAADFRLWAKAASLGAEIVYSAPNPVCQTVQAIGSTLQVDTSNGIPVPEMGDDTARAYVQEIGASSPIATNGIAYLIEEDGTIPDFHPVSGRNYKVWYYARKNSARTVAIKSFIKPKVVRFTAQMAVFSNAGGDGSSQGTRIGWLYYTIPFLQLQGNVTLTGDQSRNDTTTITGTALAYDPYSKSDTCPDTAETYAGYMIYAPDKEYDTVQGIAVLGGVLEVRTESTAQIPVRIVLKDGSISPIVDYSDFEYEISAAGQEFATVSDTGVVTGISTGTTECLITYTDDDGNTYTCYVNIEVGLNDKYWNLVGYGQVGYMVI